MTMNDVRGRPYLRGRQRGTTSAIEVAESLRCSLLRVWGKTAVWRIGCFLEKRERRGLGVWECRRSQSCLRKIVDEIRPFCRADATPKRKLQALIT